MFIELYHPQSVQVAVRLTQAVNGHVVLIVQVLRMYSQEPMAVALVEGLRIDGLCL